MSNRKMSGGRKIFAVMLAAVLLGGLVVESGRAASKELCQRALEKCVVDASAGIFGTLLGLFVTFSSCLAGYTFCRNYVVPPAAVIQ